MNSRRLDLARLQELCGSDLPQRGGGDHAVTVVHELGPLANVWLRPEVIDRARAWRDAVNEIPASENRWVAPSPERGQIGILLATHNPETLPLLRPAFVLPVEWRRGEKNSQRLPIGLADEARRVLEDLELVEPSLHLASWLEEMDADFSALEFTTDSAWAALAAGAIVTHEGGVTLPDVMVSAAWTRERQKGQGRIRSVQSIDHKLAAAAACGAKWIFVPQENRHEVEALAADHPGRELQIDYLPNLSTVPRAAIATVVSALQAKPTRDAGADFAQRSNYYVRMPRPKQDTYYRDELLAEVVAMLEPSVRDDQHLLDIDGIVIIVSESKSIVHLMVGLFDPARVLLLYDGKMAETISDLVDSLAGMPRADGQTRQVTHVQLPEDNALLEGLIQQVSLFSQNCRRVAVDLTSGYRHYMFSLVAALPGNGVPMYFDTKLDEVYRTVRPETTDLHVVQLPSPR